MGHAKWAPESVVELCQVKIKTIEIYQESLDFEMAKIAHMTDAEWRESRSADNSFSQADPPNYSKADFQADIELFIAELIRELDYYSRLTSDPRAKELWAILGRQSTDGWLPNSDLSEGESRAKLNAREPFKGFRPIRALKHREHWETLPTLPHSLELGIYGICEIPAMYAETCWYFKASADEMPFHTPSEKRAHLELIAQKAKDLKKLVDRSPYFSERWFIAEQVTRQYFPGGLHSGSRHSRAIKQSKKQMSELEPDSDAWQPHWLLGLYAQMTLGQVLNWLEDEALHQSKIAPTVKQPKGANAKRNYVLRELHAFHLYAFNQPLWNLLAASINVLFDLSANESMSADDVRPLVT